MVAVLVRTVVIAAGCLCLIASEHVTGPGNRIERQRDVPPSPA
jgi:hypothetical protein